MKLWETTLFKRLLRTAALILFGLFAVYLLADLSIHSVRFLGKNQSSLLDLSLYYIFSLSQHLDLFLTLSFLFALLRVFFDMASHGEFISLRMAGLSIHRLSRPVYFLAALSTLLSYANDQWLAPNASVSIDSFRNTVAKRKKGVRKHVHTLSLEDGSELVYQYFESKTLFDIFWLRSQDEIWHIKQLQLTTPLLGHSVDQFIRSNGPFTLAHSYPLLPIDLSLTAEEALQKFIPHEERSLSSLWKGSRTSSPEQALCRAHLHYKLSLPLLPFLISALLPPILLHFSRHKRQFLLAACSLFALISFLTILDGMLILAENRVLEPWLALWTPWLCGALIAVLRELGLRPKPWQRANPLQTHFF